MIIAIDLASPLPPYAQIRQAVMTAVADGDLQPGDRLPPIRQLAGDLGVAPNTVARAYKELEADGVVGSSGRRGTSVLPPPPPDPASDAADSVTDAVRAARARGLDAAAILDIVTTTLAID